MTTQSLIHSNAFNFMSFVQGGVDERTGQYNLSIELPELPSNALIGPSLPLRLSFSPLNNLNSGFGKGWTLMLSQYNLNDNKLDLHTGQSFKVSDNGPGEPALVPERKLELFHFENMSAGNTKRYRVAHKSGMVEWLEPQRTDLQLALPVRVEAPSGHGITLAYHPTKKECLQSIVDDTGRTLLSIDYVGDRKVDITLLPNSAAASLYSLEFSSDRLTKVILPTANGAAWSIRYEQVGELLCISRLDTPLGATELIEYQARGHLFPGSRDRAFPYVKRHVVQPGAGQADMETTYTYTAENFLGYNSLSDWLDNGLDNLYRLVDRGYTYGSTATLRRDGEAVRTVDKRYNRFHLMVEEITVEQASTRRIKTKYHERDNDFAEQPKYFQLPSTVTTSWELDCPEAPVTPRSETVTTEYDGFANQTLEVQPSGIRIERSYHPESLDPEGFVRHLEQEVVRPAEGYEGEAQTLCTRYSYVWYPSVKVDGRDQGPGWLVNQHENKYQLQADAQETVLQEIERIHVNEVTDPFAHGRLKQEITTRNARQSTIDFSYSDAPDKPTTHPVLVTRQVITGFDHGPEHHARKEITLQHSLLIGEPLLNRDDNEVVIEYEYDALRRVTRETVAPGTAYKASRNYNYTLVSSPGGKATQEQIDVKGVSTLSTVDGLNRVVEAKRIDRDFVAKNQEPGYRPTYKATYDALGYLIEEVEFDWHNDTEVPLKSTFGYDD